MPCKRNHRAVFFPDKCLCGWGPKRTYRIEPDWRTVRCGLDGCTKSFTWGKDTPWDESLALIRGAGWRQHKDGTWTCEDHYFEYAELKEAKGVKK